jgi:hypothetical protein
VITFRFYIVSTAALFLALAIGIVVGSALDERIVAGLEDQIDGVEENLDSTVQSIDDKNREIADLERYVEASAPFAVEGQLPDTTTLVVAEEGVDAAPVEDLVRRLRQAGAHTEGIVWLDARWQLGEDDARAELSTALELTGGSAATLRAEAWELVVERLGEATGAEDGTDGTDGAGGGPGGEGDTSTTSSTTTTASDDGATTTTLAPSVDLFGAAELVALEQSGFVRLQRVDGDEARSGSQLSVVFVTGAGSEFDASGSTMGELLSASTALGVPTVVADVYRPSDDEDAPERGAVLAPLRDDDASDVSTVDDLELIAGRVATVLAVADLLEGVVGHYGYGAGADAVLPEWLGP